MEIITVKHKDSLISVGNTIKVKYYPIVNDEEDKSNPVVEEVLIKSFEPVDDDIKIHTVIKDGKDNYFFEDNL